MLEFSGLNTVYGVSHLGDRHSGKGKPKVFEDFLIFSSLPFPSATANTPSSVFSCLFLLICLEKISGWNNTIPFFVATALKPSCPNRDGDFFY